MRRGYVYGMWWYKVIILHYTKLTYQLLFKIIILNWTIKQKASFLAVMTNTTTRMSGKAGNTAAYYP